MKKRRTLFLLIALTLSMVVGTFSVNADDKTPENEFRVGMETAYAPFNWTQTSDAHGAVLKNGEKILMQVATMLKLRSASLKV